MGSPIDLRRLEELGLNSSAPPGQLLYDGWLIRMLPGQVKRARSVNAVYPSQLAVEDKIRWCEQLYAGRGLPAIFRITPFSQPATLDATLAGLGFERFDTTSVETTSLDCEIESPADCEPMELAPWVDAVGRLRGSDDTARQAHLARLQGSFLPMRALAIRRQGEVVATGLTIVEGHWAGLFDIVTDPALRRQGLGERLVRGLLAAAHGLGATNAYLQVGTDNSDARRIYARHGFREQYQYWYRGQPE